MVASLIYCIASFIFVCLFLNISNSDTAVSRSFVYKQYVALIDNPQQ